MKIIYNPELKGWQIIYLPNQWRNPALWNKPVNLKVYESWASACHDLDKWAS